MGSWAAMADDGEDDWQRTVLRKGRLAADAERAAPERAWSNCPLHRATRSLFMEPKRSKFETAGDPMPIVWRRTLAGGGQGEGSRFCRAVGSLSRFRKKFCVELRPSRVSKHQ